MGRSPSGRKSPLHAVCRMALARLPRDAAYAGNPLPTCALTAGIYPVRPEDHRVRAHGAHKYAEIAVLQITGADGWSGAVVSRIPTPPASCLLLGARASKIVARSL